MHCYQLVVSFFSDGIIKHLSCFIIFNPFCDMNDIELTLYHMALLKQTPQRHSPEKAVTWKHKQGEFNSWKRDFCESFNDFCRSLLRSWAHTSNPRGKSYISFILKRLKFFCGCSILSVFSLTLSYRGFSHYYGWMCFWLLCHRVYWSLSLLTER